MKLLYTLSLLLLPVISFGQLKQIAFSELSAGSGMFLGADMTTTTITVTVQGPADRYIAFGFGTGMATGNDAMIWSTLGSGAAPLQLRDHRMIGTGAEPSVDAQQDWTVISNNVSGGNRTIVASRPLSTGDANDVTFNFAATTQNLFWAKSASASNQLVNHGGNRASGIVRNWVLVDQTPPTVNTFVPADNASGTSLTANLSITFNEPIAFGTGSILLYDETNTLIQTFFNGSGGINLSGSVVSINPTANLVAGTDYYVHIQPTAITDVAGNAFAGFTNNTTWNFNTNDVTVPALVASPFSPADNASSVSTTTNLTISFNESVQLNTGVIELFSGTNTLVESFNVASSPQVTVAGSVVTIDPTADLAMNTAYYVHVAAGAVSDLSGNNYAGIANNTTWNFNTNDVAPPTLVTPFIPADNATGVPAGIVLSVYFSEDIALTSTGTLKLFLANGTLVESFNNLSAGITILGDHLDIDPAALLLESTSYYVTIDAGFVTDPAGNTFAGFTDNTTWNFMTSDLTPPSTISNAFSPADNAVNVPVGAVLTITFDEPVAFGTGSFNVVSDDGFGTMSFDVATSSALSISGSTVTINPPTDFEGLSDYHVTMDATAVTDASGNAYAGINAATTWNFTTESGLGIEEAGNSEISWNGKLLTVTADSFSGSVIDASGKTVKAQLSASTDCSDLVTGIYFVRLQTAKGAQSFRIYVR